MSDKLAEIKEILEEPETPSQEKVLLGKKAKANRKIRDIYPVNGHCWACDQPIIDVTGGE